MKPVSGKDVLTIAVVFAAVFFFAALSGGAAYAEKTGEVVAFGGGLTDSTAWEEDTAGDPVAQTETTSDEEDRDDERPEEHRNKAPEFNYMSGAAVMGFLFLAALIGIPMAICTFMVVVCLIVRWAVKRRR